MSVAPEHRFVTPSGYEGWKAAEKLDWLWHELIEPHEYTPVTRPDLTMASPVTMLRVAGSRQVLARTLDRADDLMEPDRPKIIHAHGSVALVRLETEADSPFTGVLAPSPVGGARGIMRISLAVPAVGRAAFTPGFGLKLAVDGRPSLDILAMNHTVGQGRDVNIFANTFTHDLCHEHKELRPPQKLLQVFFRRVSHEPRRLVIDDFAATTRSGDTVTEPVRPERLVFRPGRDVRRQFRRRKVEDFRESLARVDVGSVLYEVESVDGGEAPRVIGRIVLESAFIASAGGDRLFFRHPVAEADRIRS
jgi:hypothetical protein